MTPSKTSRRKIFALSTGFLMLATGVFFGYQEFLTGGLDDLPSKPCDGAVERSTAASALPDAREARERGKYTTPGRNFTFFCYVRTSGDSTISGEAQADDASPGSWRRYYEEKQNKELVTASAGDVKALSLPTLSSVYVPCTPPGEKPSGAVQSHALIVEARTIGETRVQGTALRQVLIDFAYQIAKHAYKVGACQEPRKFPNELPRIKSN